MTDPQTRLATRKHATVGLLLTLTLLGVFPIDVVLPSFPALSEHFQSSSSDIALSVSLFAVGIAFSQLLICSACWG
jgi:DHA1 family bicyclomycin/chloramphenicol resistance-like MFS transporter